MSLTDRYVVKERGCGGRRTGAGAGFGRLKDGLAGFCDIEQRLCLGLALWNGRDPILKDWS